MTGSDPGRGHELVVRPIGFVASPHRDRHSAPRQPAAARGTPGTITLTDETGIEHALESLESWSHLWVLFWFHLNTGFRPKVAPPRSQQKRGVFATRAPYRPNPIGLSLVRLARVDGRVLHIVDVDMLDGTPVLDLKPYLPYADAAPDATDGWLASATDPAPRYHVCYSELSETQLAWLASEGVDWVRQKADAVLQLGPAPHPYRRIKSDGDHMRLALKDLRLRFHAAGTTITVDSIHSGCTPRALADPAARAKGPIPLDVHRRFVGRFGS